MLLMTHRVEIPEHVYQIAQRAAAKEGITPEAWIAATVSRAGTARTGEIIDTQDRPPRRDVLARYIGSIDSSACRPENPGWCTEYGDIVAEKLRRQGLDIS